MSSEAGAWRERARMPESGDAGGGEIDARIGTQLDRIVEVVLLREPGSEDSKSGEHEGQKSW